MAARGPWWAPPLLAVQFLTRLPVPGTAALSGEAVAIGLVRAVAWFPLVGTLIGCVTAAVAVGAAMWWPAWVAALLALAVEALVTGAFHEDAVADFCDGFGGGQSADDIRRIMKDSRIGSYGSVGLIIAIGLRAALIATLLGEPAWVATSAIVASGTFGRLLVVAMMAVVAPAPGVSGLAKDIGSGVGGGTLCLALATAAPGIFPFAWAEPGRFAAALLAAAVFALWLRRLLLRRLGGSTGDCLGFAAYVGQLILLGAASAQ